METIGDHKKRLTENVSWISLFKKVFQFSLSLRQPFEVIWMNIALDLNLVNTACQ